MKKEVELINNQFLSAISAIDRGKLVDQAGKAITQLAAAVKTTQKKGEVTLKVTLKHDDRGGVRVSGVVTKSIPKPALRPMFKFVDDDGMLCDRDPDQEEMEPIVRAVEGGSQDQPEDEAQKVAS